MEGLIYLSSFILLLVIGYVAGTRAEKKHYRSIEKREAETLQLPVHSLEELPVDPKTVETSRLVCGCAVISVDYFKQFLAGLRKIFGGPVTSYETLLDRARREAVLRMKENASRADMILNVRIETSSIGKRSNQKGVGCVEALAYGTAVFLKE